MVPKQLRTTNLRNSNETCFASTQVIFPLRLRYYNLLCDYVPKNEKMFNVQSIVTAILPSTDSSKRNIHVTTAARWMKLTMESAVAVPLVHSTDWSTQTRDLKQKLSIGQ